VKNDYYADQQFYPPKDAEPDQATIDRKIMENI
jgi:hypothetical protein